MNISAKKMINDEEAPCDVCRSKYSEPSNEMVFCDMCDICVHQACYGVTDIPEGPWFCKPCMQNVRPKCIFCPSKKGAMKETKNSNWAHVSCALWIPEVSFGIPETMDNIVNTEKIPKSRWSLTCSLCHVRGGACIQCYVKKCRIAYHVTCAFEYKLHMEMEDIEGGDQEIKFESFCLTHTAAHASGQNPHTSSESSKKRKRVQENLESNEDENSTWLPQTKSPLEGESRASTSRDTGFTVSTSERAIEGSENNVKNVNGAELFTEKEIEKFSKISKGTARKSFALPPKNIQTLHQIQKMSHIETGKFSDKSKRPLQKVSSSKKPKTKSIKPKTKPVIHSNPSMQFSPHKEGSSTTQNNRPALTEPQFSGLPHEQSFSNSSYAVDDIRQLFPTPTRQESPTLQNEHQLLTESETPQNLTNSNSTNNLSLNASNAQQFLTSHNNQHTLSDITAGNSTITTLSSTSKNDNFDDFSRYIKSLLQNLPFKKTLRVQQKIIALVVKECGISSDDEFDALSLSSDE